ncbi:iron-sulfur cluster assembly scaffold protein [Candidatus Berkelbacteria bacterium]|nr:iron-sulfur cluster assembly scaffold protein [Candidatus Berkelbacteria bacterium]
MQSLYSELVLDYFYTPRYTPPLANPDYESQLHNTYCADSIYLTFVVNKQMVIQAVGAEVKGCALAHVGASVLAEQIIDRTLSEVKNFQPEQILSTLQLVSISPLRLNCFLLAYRSFQKALCPQAIPSSEKTDG